MAVSAEVENLCRLCMSRFSTDDTTKIFQEQDNSSGFSMKIMSTLGVEVHKSDQLPKKMCTPCVYQLEKFYIFRRQCRRTDAKFRSFVRKVKSKKISRLEELSDDEGGDDGGGDTDQAFVQNYERMLVDQQVSAQLHGHIQEKVETSSRQLLQQIKRTLYETIDNLVIENELTSKAEHQEVFPEEEEQADVEPRRSPKRVFTSQCAKPVRKSSVKVKAEPKLVAIEREVEVLFEDAVASESDENDENEGEETYEEEYQEQTKDPPIEMEYESEASVILKDGLIHNCKKCGRKFSSIEKLQKHQIYHVKDKNICEDCGKCFSSSGSLFRHMKIHSEVKDFQCQVCKKSFTQKGSLLRHLLVHQNDRPFPCDQCDKSFSQRHLLTSHATVAHSDTSVTTIFRCNECPKTFRYSSGLSRHALSHSGKPFNCDRCNKQLADYSSLQRHMKLVHKEEN